jgi:acyl carrier protein
VSTQLTWQDNKRQEIAMNVELNERTKRTVLDVTRAVTNEEVAEEFDPIGAGFDSIWMLELASRLEELLGVDCSIEDIFSVNSLRELSEILAQRVEAAGVRA